jgi:hypothetical protein
MGVVCAILGFLVGTSLGSSAFLFALSSGARESAYWSFVKQHPTIEPLAKLWVTACILACGVVFAYLAYSLV